MPDSNQSHNKWQFDKTISAGNVISMLLITLSGLTWAGSVDRRVELNAKDISYLRQQQLDSRQRVENVRDEIKSDLKTVNAKLDRLIERQ